MLMFHNTRMGYQPYTPAALPTCDSAYWTNSLQDWFHPYYPVMTEIIDDVHSLPPSSPQSEDSTNSSNLSDYHISEASSDNKNYYASFKIQTNTVSDEELSEHKTELQFRCKWKHCQCTFDTLYLLSDHVASYHSDVNGGLFYCGWEGCSRGDKGFNARYKMLVHVRTHTNEKPHRCKQCEKSFSRAENLKIHTRSHSGEKPYTCPVEGCNKAYSNSSDRFKHTRTHSVDKPYCCKVPGCPKRYTDPSSLRKHVKTYKHTTVPSSVNMESLDKIEEHSEVFKSTDENFTSSLNEKNINNLSEEKVKYGKRKYPYEENNIDMTDIISYKKINQTGGSCSIIPSTEDWQQSHEYDSIACTHKTQLDDSTSVKNQLHRPYLDEPLNLKLYKNTYSDLLYENGVLNLEKKIKMEEKSYFPESKLADIPLDLSLRKSLL